MHNPLCHAMTNARENLSGLKHSDETGARPVQVITYTINIHADQREVAFAPLTGDHDGFDICGARLQDCGNGIVCGPQIKRTRVDHDDIGLHAGFQSTDVIGKA